jgi:hypothetical protein
MRHRKLGLGLVAIASMAAALPLLAQPAFADYAPAKGDVVGVGSDTLQYMIDFVADGDVYADPGYNAALNKFKLISFDATADQNARLAYGVNGGGTSCTPGTGGTKGTGNQQGNHADQPCVLNPTIELRAGQQPVTRPNGSGAGVAALEQDIAAGNNLPSGPNQEIINFSRASSAQASAAGFGLDQLAVASDTLPMLCAKNTPSTTVTAGSAGVVINSTNFSGTQTLSVANTQAIGNNGTIVVDGATLSYTGTTPAAPVVATPGTLNNVSLVSGGGATLATGNAVAVQSNCVTVSSTELGNIYKQSTTGTNAYGGTGCVTWNQLPGNAAGSSDFIIPVIPQVGSGTRSFFLSGIGGVTPGNCDQVAEENDPTADAQQAFPQDAIEPISNGRLQLFLGTTNPSATAGYFLDPSCPYKASTAACGTGTVGLTQTFTVASESGVNVSTFPTTGAGGTLSVGSITGFTATGSLEVETQSGNAVLSYTGTTASPPAFTGVLRKSAAFGGVQSGLMNGAANNQASNLVFQGANSYVPNAVTPQVTVDGTCNYSVTPPTCPNASDGNPLYDPQRNLFIYFRDSDLYSTVGFQPGTSENWLNALFYDPCITGVSTGCVANTGSTQCATTMIGPNGQPFIDQAAGQVDLSDAGVSPFDTDCEPVPGSLNFQPY